MAKYKFRVWNKEFKCWDNTAWLEADDDGELIHIGDREGVNTVIQQWTGILDINGKEIYEGDILKETHYACDYSKMIPVRTSETYEYIGVVYLPKVYPYASIMSSHAEAYPVTYRTHPLNTTLGQIIGNHITKDPEVIGNIFDNPELYVYGPYGPKTVDEKPVSTRLIPV